MNPFYLVLGLVTGVLGGLFGLGGAVVIIPALVFLCGFIQHQAQGIIIAAMIPPIGLLATIRYYHAGNVKVWAAALIALGFFIGGYFGARLVEYTPDPLLKKIFAILLFLISLRMFFNK
ncbi:MAG: permease [Candidatus Omnitrophica bacterium CG1_02_44_16]|nr:MAG: permease [Candidatus Omnitrophica bacterium CG1_02_44_16]PIY82888.1 MAG: permease [Candidatus Omnitrophica bacterium CG_4_10_14_0_8_um_filter_44_12]PIZ83910.1 MAG: permease [Candidatus Omnitrophica bacterium CG_4_10_14_0_2_um_filter_44_9]